MIHFEGVESFDQPPAELFAKLADAGFLVKSLPDSEVLEATPDRGVWKLRPKLSFISGTIETTLTVDSRTPPNTASYTIVGKAVGASSTVTATLNFQPSGPGTNVNWVADITALTGLLKLVPKGLIQSAAKKVIEDVWASVRCAL